MSSNPLMMGYDGGDLLLTGVAWPTVRSPPRPVCAGCGRWPGWRAALVQWRECIRGGLTAGLTAYATIHYINRRSLPFFTFTPPAFIRTLTWSPPEFINVICSNVPRFSLHMLILSVYIYLDSEKQGIICVSTKCWGSYDVTSVWLVLWQLCISRRPADPGVYLGPGV